MIAALVRASSDTTITGKIDRLRIFIHYSLFVIHYSLEGESKVSRFL